MVVSASSVVDYVNHQELLGPVIKNKPSQVRIVVKVTYVHQKKGLAFLSKRRKGDESRRILILTEEKKQPRYGTAYNKV